MTVSADVSTQPQLRTFLIADVRGYTRFTAEHGDDAAAHLAATFAALARDAVEARSGRVIELRGDEVLAVFDAADQSVRAALELQWTLAEEVAIDPSLPLLVGIGIAAGEAVPVEDGFRGAALNLAARLCSTASAGEVLLSEWIAELAGPIDGTSFQNRGTVELKGFPDPVPYLSVAPDRVPSRVLASETGGSRGSSRRARRESPAHRTRARDAMGPREPGARSSAGWDVCSSSRDRPGSARRASPRRSPSTSRRPAGRCRYAGAGGTAIADILASIECGPNRGRHRRS